MYRLTVTAPDSLWGFRSEQRSLSLAINQVQPRLFGCRVMLWKHSYYCFFGWVFEWHARRPCQDSNALPITGTMRMAAGSGQAYTQAKVILC